MDIKPLSVSELNIVPIEVRLYIPPMVWKGDPVGHIGTNDIFFYILEGECFLNIDNQYYIARPGQLVFLPKGKHRAYTHSSKNLCIYEMAFSVEMQGDNLMQRLELSDSDFLVDITSAEEIKYLFENSYHVEMYKNPVYDIGWCANILNIIRIYAQARQQQAPADKDYFAPVIAYMKNHLDQAVSIEELAALVPMQPTYFIRRFKASYGMPPIAYLGQLRLYKAMELLSSTSFSMEQISTAVGILDSAYFARFFKKHCGVTPRDYRSTFRK